MKYNKEILEPIIKSSKSNREVILKLGLKEAGGNYTTVKNLIIEFDLDTSHFTGLLWSKGSNSFKDDRIKTKYDNDNVFVENSMVSNERIKKLLVTENHMENKCLSCGNTGEWLGKPISLELDHINGINNDNRLKNLRILCPNCHSQTPTFRKKKSSL